MIRNLIVVAMIAASAIAGLAQSDLRWFKGNTHTHTLNSDGDSPPAEVVKWYADNGYHFLFITDHEFITREAPLNEQFGKPQQFLVIEGQEVTDRVDKKPYHLNALGVSSVIMPHRGTTPVGSLQNNIDRITAAGGVAQLNHPNFGWALTAAEIRQLRGVTMMEIYNGHPLVNNLGGGGSPSVEEIWDTLLSTGMKIYGAGTDDSHYFKKLGVRSAPTPGQAWIYVKARSLSAAGILESLRNGDFYASTGVELTTLDVDARKINIVVKAETSSKYRIDFIGRNGRILQSVAAPSAEYRFRGNEGYVRTRVVESNGKIAWTQPVFVDKKRS